MVVTYSFTDHVAPEDECSKKCNWRTRVNKKTFTNNPYTYGKKFNVIIILRTSYTILHYYSCTHQSYRMWGFSCRCGYWSMLQYWMWGLPTWWNKILSSLLPLLLGNIWPMPNWKGIHCCWQTFKWFPVYWKYQAQWSACRFQIISSVLEYSSRVSLRALNTL